MRIIIFLLLISFLIKPVFSQTPTKKEMQEQMLEAIKELNNQIADLEKQIAEAKKNKEDEESIKQMEEQVAMLKKQVEMMGGVSKNVSKLSDKTFQKAADQENSDGVPKKDLTRINALPKETLTDAALALFVQKVYSEIDKRLSASQKNNGKELYDEINNKEKSSTTTGNIGVQCWMAGSTDMGLWLLGKSCLDDMSNTDNLCNYASLLSMVGGEHLAIPILQNLQNKFPDNTTILNNLGQAWYGLGDMDNAKKYLDNTLHFPGAHSLATETKSEIEQSQGQTQESIESLKRSIKEDYTTEKEARLNKKGVTLKYDDIPWKYPGPAEPLGYEKFMLTIPEYPMEGGVATEFKRKEWDDYREKLSAAMKALDVKIKQLEAQLKVYEAKVMNDPFLLKPYNNNVYKTAKRKLMLLFEWGIDRTVDLDKKMRKAVDTVEKWKDEYQKALPEDCGGRLAAAASFNTNANTLWHQLNYEWMSFQKQFLGSQARLYLYACTDRSEYELNVALIKSHFLGYLYVLRCEFEVGCIKTESEKPAGKVLPDFDEMNCQYKTELAIPYFEKTFSIKVECNKMTTEFDVKYLKGSLEENLANGKYHGTVEVQGKIGSDMEKYGPIQIGTQIKAGAGVDFNEGGIQDVYVTGKVGVKAGSESISAVSTSISSIEAKMSLVTGKGSVTGKGAFSGINIK